MCAAPIRSLTLPANTKCAAHVGERDMRTGNRGCLPVGACGHPWGKHSNGVERKRETHTCPRDGSLRSCALVCLSPTQRQCRVIALRLAMRPLLPIVARCLFSETVLFAHVHLARRFTNACRSSMRSARSDMPRHTRWSCIAPLCSQFVAPCPETRLARL